ncbi:hypothetical protein TYRP_001631 [Tyrophagus putrescentiae]|nr:hypothetical protein TYRP_001631 [Tyrophagus putrescentiae]
MKISKNIFELNIIIVKNDLKASSVNSATKTLIINLISNDIKWCILTYKCTNVQLFPNHLDINVISRLIS